MFINEGKFTDILAINKPVTLRSCKKISDKKERFDDIMTPYSKVQCNKRN